MFDETFMADLQTRAYPKLVYVLAAALKMEAPTSHGGILEIAQLADVSAENKRKCEATAQEFLGLLRHTTPASLKAGRSHF